MINFILGLIIGGLFGIGLMCLLQINRDNELQRRINKAIEYIDNKLDLFPKGATTLDLDKLYLKAIKKILGGDVDDE